ncbi:MAG: hypothetical protein ACXAD7_17810 [Candidatus Kariarchaeaceae archaeon]|jgi:uncharacterized membrane protein YedE/YeeE
MNVCPVISENPWFFVYMFFMMLFVISVAFIFFFTNRILARTKKIEKDPEDLTDALLDLTILLFNISFSLMLYFAIGIGDALESIFGISPPRSGIVEYFPYLMTLLTAVSFVAWLRERLSQIPPEKERKKQYAAEKHQSADFRRL